MKVKHGFIGFGNLAKAVYQGLREEKDIEFAYFARSRKEVNIPYYDKINDLVAFADVIWLMIKPQDLSTILEELEPLDRFGKIVVSPVAGRNIAFIERYLGKEQLILRIMPNLAMAYRKSVTAFASNQPENENAVAIFHLLEKLGKAVRLEENGFDLFTAVFGSGPAFILAFIQIFKEKMQEFNLPGALLDELLLELTQGTTLYFSQNQKSYSIEQLIQNITSKGGTTQAGLDYFRTHEIGKHFEGILDAAKNRSEEMSRNGD
ncbi:MAG: pyrroline-5-carboxylate reductase dimerization domain-containing protein [Proteiniphilum sp.]|uniref:pyrroline-5-carboxylate reductase family protein n=1 Tax=Proteiniphilum sp. TaxID=1926877 RepID=UPI002B2175E1|nr:pyrroline-5-carboxylate reductase dimerization domain-containing protein [Proteiniphilum sp.]MEA5128635.1 pyrroline-5-carboxylate reductase dimerization domain-containing protein [Proteiniphilum sp.]